MATFTVSTKANDKAVAKQTILTVNMGKPEVRDALAMQALVVKWQGQARKHGIPDKATINMDDYAPGTRHNGVVDPREAYKVMSPEQRKAFLADLAAMK